jgi:hypothetical protein
LATKGRANLPLNDFDFYHREWELGWEHAEWEPAEWEHAEWEHAE